MSLFGATQFSLTLGSAAKALPDSSEPGRSRSAASTPGSGLIWYRTGQRTPPAVPASAGPIRTGSVPSEPTATTTATNQAFREVWNVATPSLSAEVDRDPFADPAQLTAPRKEPREPTGRAGPPLRTQTHALHAAIAPAADPLMSRIAGSRDQTPASGLLSSSYSASRGS